MTPWGRIALGKRGRRHWESQDSLSHAPGSYETRLHLGLIFPSTERLWIVCLLGAGCPGPALVAAKQQPHPGPGTRVRVIRQALTSPCQSEAATRAMTAKPAPDRWRGVGYSGAGRRCRALPPSLDHSRGSPCSEVPFREQRCFHPSHVIYWVF